MQQFFDYAGLDLVNKKATGVCNKARSGCAWKLHSEDTRVISRDSVRIHTGARWDDQASSLASGGPALFDTADGRPMMLTRRVLVEMVVTVVCCTSVVA